MLGPFDAWFLHVDYRSHAGSIHQGDGHDALERSSVCQGKCKPCRELRQLGRRDRVLPSLEQEGRSQVSLADGSGVGVCCRGGSDTVFSFGDDAAGLENYAWFRESAKNIGETYPHQVGQKRANGFGIHDMLGNVIEWCSDWYAEDYQPKSPTVDPKGPASGTEHIMRGGSWSSFAPSCRSAPPRLEHSGVPCPLQWVSLGV